MITSNLVGDFGEHRELRRSYHDRISDLRADSAGILACALRGLAVASAATAAGAPSSAEIPDFGAELSREQAASADDQVVDLLALQSPVARDLRVILASRDVTHISRLCVGLATTLVTRIAAVWRISDPTLRDLVEAVGARTAELLHLAASGWIALDRGTAARVIATSEEARRAQVAFLGRLLGLAEVPIDAAVDLALTARSYDRLADHAIEIAERTLFVAGG